MTGEPLPLPPHVDLSRVGEVWKVDYARRFDEARAWARRHAIGPAAEDRVRVPWCSSMCKTPSACPISSCS